MKEKVSGAEAPQVAFTPETSQFSSAAAQLGELFSVSPEIAEQITPRMHAMTARLVATAADPHARDTAICTGNALSWLYLGQPGQTLPDGIIVTHSLGNETVEYDRRRWLSEDCIVANLRRLNSLGLEDIANTVQADLESRMPEAIAVLEALITMTPAYDFLQSFDRRSLRERAEIPLTPERYQLRAAEKTEEVRRSNLLYQNETIAKGTAEYFLLRRELGRLDNETMFTEATPHTNPDALARARYYFASEYVEQEFPHFPPGVQQQMTLEIFNNYSEHETTRDIIHDFPRQLITRFHGQKVDALTFCVSEEFLRVALKHMATASLGVDYQRMLAEATSVAASDMAELVSYVHWLSLRGIDDMDDFHLRSWLLAPRGEFVAPEILKNHPDIEHEHDLDVYFLPKAELEAQQETMIGRLDGRVNDSQKRVITVTKRDSELPDRYPDADLSLTLREKQFEHRDPYIPGYKLVARMDIAYPDIEKNSEDEAVNNDMTLATTRSYSFIRQHDSDPYTFADIVIPCDAVERTAQHYDTMGLRMLAEKMRQADQLSVDQWLNMVRGSTIFFKSDADEAKPLPIAELSDFRILVHNDALRIQSPAIGDFLRLSLDTMFGVGSAGLIVGNELPDNVGDGINALKYRQTTFAYDGRQYILDGMLPPVESRAAQESGQTSAAPKVPRIPRELDLDALYGVGKISSGPSREEQVLSALSSLEGFARMYMGITVDDRETLYAANNKRPENDPLRNVLETLLQISYGDTFTRADLRRLHQKIWRYGERQRRDGDRVNPYAARYSESTLQMLISVIKSAQKLINKDPSAESRN